MKVISTFTITFRGKENAVIAKHKAFSGYGCHRDGLVMPHPPATCLIDGKQCNVG